MEYATLLRDKMGLRRTNPDPETLLGESEKIQKPQEPNCWRFCCYRVSICVKVIGGIEISILCVFVAGILYEVAILGNHYSVVLLFLVLLIGSFHILLFLGVKYDQPCPLMPYLIWKGSELCLDLLAVIILGSFYSSGVFESLHVFLLLVAGIVVYFCIGLFFLLTVKQCREYYIRIQEYYERMEKILDDSPRRRSKTRRQGNQENLETPKRSKKVQERGRLVRKS